MTRIVSTKRATLDALEERIESTFVRVGDGRLHRPFRVDAQGRETAPGSLGIPIQALAAAHAASMSEVRSRVPLAEGNNARFFPPVAYNRLEGHLNPPGVNGLVDLQSLTFEVQQSARNLFTSAQQLSLSKMISEWLSLVGDLIECAAAAETA
jgi:hypothetical protein